MPHNKNLFSLGGQLQNAFGLLVDRHPYMSLRQADAVV